MTKNSQKLLIGLGGYKESGKDTFASFLPEAGWKLIGMSDKLYKSLYTLNPHIPEAGVTLQELHERHNGDYNAVKNTYSEVRRLLRVFGTEVGRELLGENVWADDATKRIEKFHAQGFNVAITGIRFRNELTMVRSFPRHELVWVERPGVDNTGDTHASENTLSKSDFNVTVLNDAGLENLQQKAEELLRNLE